VQRLGGVAYQRLSFDYLNDRLIGFRLWTPAENYDALHTLIVRTYGPPSSEDAATNYADDGTPIHQTTSLWKTGAGILELLEHSTPEDQSRLMMIIGPGGETAIQHMDRTPAPPPAGRP
jgi:hypothetical protein